MATLKTTLVGLSALVLAVSNGRAEGRDFGVVKGLKLIETPHYRLYYKGKSPSDFKTVVEKVWAESERLLPRIRPVFEKGDMEADVQRDESGKPVFPLPGAAASGNKSPTLAAKEEVPADALKLDLVFLQDRYEYEAVVRSLLPANLPAEQKEKADTIIKGTSTFVASDRRTRAFWSDDPNMVGRGYDIFVAHCLGTDLMNIHQGEETPFWLSAGYGYYMEFKLFKKSVTAYLDYAKYYSEQYGDGKGGEGKLDSKDTLAVGKPWAPILRRLMRKGKTATVQEVMTAQTSNLTPERCGYVYSFMSYLLSTPRIAQNFARGLLKLRDEGLEEQEKILVEALGQRDAAALQKEWHKYVLSEAFR